MTIIEQARAGKWKSGEVISEQQHVMNEQFISFTDEWVGKAPRRKKKVYYSLLLCVCASLKKIKINLLLLYCIINWLSSTKPAIAFIIFNIFQLIHHFLFMKCYIVRRSGSWWSGWLMGPGSALEQKNNYRNRIGSCCCSDSGTLLINSLKTGVGSLAVPSIRLKNGIQGSSVRAGSLVFQSPSGLSA